MNWDFDFITNGQMVYFLQGAKWTLIISLASVVLGVIFGSLLTLLKRSKIKIFKFVSSAYVEIVRGTPLLLQIFIVYFGLSNVLNRPPHAVEHGAARGKLPGLRSLPVHAVQSPVQQREVQAHPATGLDVVLFIQKQGIQLYDQRRDRRGGGQIPRQRPEGDPCGAAGTGARGADCPPADVFRQQLIVLHMKESWL